MTELEILELYVCAKEIAKKFEDKYGMKSYSLVLEDGPSAGQQTKHVHLNIIPRDKQFNGPQHISLGSDNRYDRSENDMAQEAELYRELFEVSNK